MVEHYYHRFGGYSPSPLLFLAAAAQRTRAMRLITGAVLPRLPATTSPHDRRNSPARPFWVAALATDESFVNAGKNGHGVMAIPLAGAEMAPVDRALPQRLACGRTSR
jgi:alkanesulfonate monooxygenase SsuD/methylene tetrahydromethanopterin reductase-like flavin-dependent oxidoreductase (luciferase family)